MFSLPESGSHLSAILPPGLISLTRLLVLSEPDFKSARSKGKLPKGDLRKGDIKDNKEVLEILDKVLEQREGMYIGGNVEVRRYIILATVDSSPLTCVRQDDECLLSLPEALTGRKRHAVIVRLGEKRILRDVRQTLRIMLAEFSPASGAGYGNKKGDTRKDKMCGNGGKETGSGRKHVIDATEGNHGWKRARK